LRLKKTSENADLLFMANNVFWVFYDSISKIQSNPLSTDEAQSTIMKIRPNSITRFFIWTQGWQNWQPLKSYLESDQKVFVSTFTISKTNEETLTAAFKEITELTQTQTHTSFPHEQTNTNTNTNTGTSTYSHIKLDEDTISKLVKTESHKSFDAEEITWSNVKKPDFNFSKVLTKAMGKRETRHDLKIEVLLISRRGKTFRSKSKNISLSGALLEDTIPFEFYDTPFDLVVLSTITKDPKKARVKLEGITIGEVKGGRTQRIQYNNPNEDQKLLLQSLLEEYLEAKKNSDSRSKAG
jgi:hypothetical protein